MYVFPSVLTTIYACYKNHWFEQERGSCAKSIPDLPVKMLVCWQNARDRDESSAWPDILTSSQTPMALPAHDSGHKPCTPPPPAYC